MFVRLLTTLLLIKTILIADGVWSDLSKLNHHSLQNNAPKINYSQTTTNNSITPIIMNSNVAPTISNNRYETNAIIIGNIDDQDSIELNTVSNISKPIQTPNNTTPNNSVWSDTSNLLTSQNIAKPNIVERGLASVESNTVDQIESVKQYSNTTDNSVWSDTSNLTSNQSTIDSIKESDSAETTLSYENVDSNQYVVTEDISDGIAPINLNPTSLKKEKVKKAILEYIDNRLVLKEPDVSTISYTVVDESDGIESVNSSIISTSPTYTDGVDNVVGGSDFHNTLLHINKLPYKSLQSLYYITPSLVKYKNNKGKYVISDNDHAIKYVNSTNKFLDDYIIALVRLSDAIKAQKSPINSFSSCHQLSGYYPKRNSCFDLFNAMDVSEKNLLLEYGNSVINKDKYLDQ